MKNLLKLTTPVIALILGLSLLGCESKEDQDLFAGQVCLDHAKTEAEATVCVNKVAGYESAQAYLIRCSANFIAQVKRHFEGLALFQNYRY